MPKLQWIGALSAVVLGAGLVLQPNLISSLPAVLHYGIGAALVGTGAATWYFAGSYIGASICNLTGYFCVANTEASATPPKAEVPKV